MRYPSEFQKWWNENMRSETLLESYKNYRIDVACTDEKPMSYKKWAFGVYQDN